MPAMFQLAMPWWEFILRALMVYFVLMLMIRLSGKRSMGGSPPLSRTLTRRPIEALRSVHVEAKEVQCGVQAWCG